MKNISFIFFVVLAWSFSLINTSGLGITYDTPTKTNVFIFIWFLFLIISRKNILLKVIKTNSLLIFFTIISFILLPFLKANSWEGFTYLMMVPMVYCFSEQKVTAKALRMSGFIVAGLGLFVLYVYKNTDILSGWNDNHISMIGLFSYVYYSISLYGNMSGRKLTIGIAISLMYIFMLNSTDSRSSIIFIIISIITAYNGNWFRWLLERKIFMFIALNIPIIITLVSILFPNLFIFEYFEKWSLDNFDKEGLNGRDTLWLEAYNRLFDSYFIGEGKFTMNHHNCGIAVLSVFGVIGYICWYKILAKLIQFMLRHVGDSLMLGFISSFLLIFFQQSFELGLVSPSPNMIPYMILGLGIARIKRLNKQNQMAIVRNKNNVNSTEALSFHT